METPSTSTERRATVAVLEALAGALAAVRGAADRLLAANRGVWTAVAVTVILDVVVALVVVIAWVRGPLH